METTAPLTFEESITRYLDQLAGKNRSAGTIRGYTTNLRDFVCYLRENDITVHSPADVTRGHINEFLIYCVSERKHSGVYRARMLSVIREFFRFLELEGDLPRSPAENIDNPAKERKTRNSLRPDEYNKILAIAGGNSRDYALFQVLLQTGVRVSELCNLEIEDVDLAHALLIVRSVKGKADREIALEKAIGAITNYLKDRPKTISSILFLNRYGEPLGERGVRKLISRYTKAAGLDKKVSPHVFRHTFGTIKAESGKVSPFQLQQLPEIIVIAGAPGAGKTTVSRALHGEMRWPYVELGQHLRQLHLDPHWETASAREEQMSFENLIMVTRNYLKYDYMPILITDLEDFRVQEIPSLFPDNRYRIITLVCSDEELKRRVLEPTRDSGFRDVIRTQEWNAMVKARPLVRNEYRMDTTGQTIEQTVQAVLERIRLP